MIYCLLFSAPVVVTSQTHQPVGSNFQVTSHSYHQVTAPIHQMPYNAPVYNPNQSVIVNHANSPYPPPTASFPATHNMSPPPYNEVVNLNSELYPKQQPYNPNFNSTG